MRTSVVWTNELAVAEARRLADAQPDLTIVNIPVWAFPHFTMRAARELPGPLLLFSNVDPQYPGMVGMLAAAGALDQIGRTYGRAWGDVERSETVERGSRRTFAPAPPSAAARLDIRPDRRPADGHVHRGLEPDRWMAQFGVDVEEIDQWELVRRRARSTRGA